MKHFSARPGSIREAAEGFFGFLALLPLLSASFRGTEALSEAAASVLLFPFCRVSPLEPALAGAVMGSGACVCVTGAFVPEAGMGASGAGKASRFASFCLPAKAFQASDPASGAVSRGLSFRGTGGCSAEGALFKSSASPAGPPPGLNSSRHSRALLFISSCLD